MYIRCADLHIFWCITACGYTEFNVNVHMRKSVFPRTRICTVLSEFPHVEIHKSMCKSAPRKYAFPHVEIHMRSCISACGNTPKIVNFPTCGNTHFLVYFYMRKFEREGEFLHVSLQADLWISAGKNVREYTFSCWFPRAEIHAERCITACGNTLNQVQKNSSNSNGRCPSCHVWLWKMWGCQRNLNLQCTPKIATNHPWGRLMLLSD